MGSESLPGSMKDSSLSSKIFFNSIKKYSDLETLVHDGTAEDQSLECKLINSPSGFSQNLEAELRKEISGFANTNGGVIAFGLDCDNKRGIDVITQICPIGQIKDFESKFKVKAPLLVRQRIDFETKIIRKKKADTKGVLLAFIYPSAGDPIQASDGKFYLRVGDQTPEMPYEVLKRMFIGSYSPDLDVEIDFKYVSFKSDSFVWEIPMTLVNNSNFPAKNTRILLHVPSQKNVVDVKAPRYVDIGNVNRFSPKGWYFSLDISGNIYKSISLSLPPFNLKMESKRIKASFYLSVYSENMRAKSFNFDVYLPKSGVPKVNIRDRSYIDE